MDIWKEVENNIGTPFSITNGDCWKCRYFTEGLRCKAFPKQIPDDILFGIVHHSSIVEGQINQTIFESIHV